MRIPPFSRKGIAPRVDDLSQARLKYVTRQFTARRNRFSLFARYAFQSRDLITFTCFIDSADIKKIVKQLIACWITDHRKTALLSFYEHFFRDPVKARIIMAYDHILFPMFAVPSCLDD